MAQGWQNGLYLSCLWSDLQNSFACWKLVQIVIDFYSIKIFLSFIVWPLEVAEVTRVSCVKFFQQKIQNFNFLATNMLYTSKEHIFLVEFKFTTKNRIWLKKMGRKFVFLIFALKMRATRYLRELISKNCTNKSQKWLYQGLVEASTWKVTKGELCISAHLESAGDLLSDGPLCPPYLNRVK